jgi:hypothetical protein
MRSALTVVAAVCLGVSSLLWPADASASMALKQDMMPRSSVGWSDPGALLSFNPCLIVACGRAKPSAPGQLAPSGLGTPNPPTFAWGVAGATGYAVYDAKGDGAYDLVETMTGGSPVCSNSSFTCQYTPSSALPTGKHRWWVIGWNAEGWGQWSAGKDYCINPCTPYAPTLTEPTGTVSENRPIFEWNRAYPASSQPVTGYAVYDIGPNGQYDMADVFPANSYCSDTTCGAPPLNSKTLPNGRHTFWVVGYNDAGWGDWSAGRTYCINTC